MAAVSMTAQPCSFSAAARGPMPQWWPNVFEPVHTRTLLDWSQRGNLESALKVSRGRAEPAPPGTEPTPVPLTSVLAEPKLPVQGVHTSRCSAMTKIPTPLSSRRKRTSSTESELPQKFDDVMKVFLEECDGLQAQKASGTVPEGNPSEDSQESADAPDGTNLEFRGPRTFRCHLHVRTRPRCKFCDRFLAATSTSTPLHVSNSAQPHAEKSSFAPRLRHQILKSCYFKSIVDASIEDIFQDLLRFADHAEPYSSGETLPSTLFCCVFRLTTLDVAHKELVTFLECTTSPYVRAAGFLYIRYKYPLEAWKEFKKYLFDTEEFAPGTDAVMTTMGKWLATLLAEDKYFKTVLPRLPQASKLETGTKLMKLPQLRILYSHNAMCLGLGPVEVLRAHGWVRGSVTSLLFKNPHRLRCVVRLEDEGVKLEVSIGMVRLIPQRVTAATGDRAPSHSRSPKRVRTTASSDARAPTVEACSREMNKDDLALREAFLRRERAKATSSLAPSRIETMKTVLMGKDGGHESLTKEEREQVKRARCEFFAKLKDPVHSEGLDEREPTLLEKPDHGRCRLMQVMEKYGSSGTVRSSRLEYHEVAAQKCIDLVDAADTLRLG